MFDRHLTSIFSDFKPRTAFRRLARERFVRWDHKRDVHGRFDVQKQYETNVITSVIVMQPLCFSLNRQIIAIISSESRPRPVGRTSSRNPNQTIRLIALSLLSRIVPILDSTRTPSCDRGTAIFFCRIVPLSQGQHLYCVR